MSAQNYLILNNSSTDNSVGVVVIIIIVVVRAVNINHEFQNIRRAGDIKENHLVLEQKGHSPKIITAFNLQTALTWILSPSHLIMHKRVKRENKPKRIQKCAEGYKKKKEDWLSSGPS